MGKILDAFANNILNTVEFTKSHSPERKKLTEKHLKLYNQLIQQLNDDEKNTLEKLLDLISDESYYDVQYSFIHGYCLGTMMTTEIFSEQETFIIK